jgi:hypothetical protein
MVAQWYHYVGYLSSCIGALAAATAVAFPFSLAMAKVGCFVAG